MPFVDEPITDTQKNDAYLSGTGDLPTTGAGGAVASTEAQSVEQPQAQTSQAQTQAPQTQQTQTVDFGGGQTGSLQERLINPINTGVAAGQQGLQQAETGFYEQAGPERTYESTGAQDSLQGAVYDPTEQNAQAAQGFLGASYAGPQGLNGEGFQSSLDDVRARAGALSGGQLQSYISNTVAGLTPGMARLDARQLSENQGFRDQRQAARSTVDDLYAQFAQSQQAAQDYAQKRQTQEQSIADQSRDYLTGERGTLDSTLQQAVQAADARNDAVGEAYKGLSQGGSYNDLQGVDSEFLGFNPQDFNSPGRQQLSQANIQKASILNDPRYASLSPDIGNIRINSHGHERFTVDPEGKTNRGDLSKKEYELYKDRYSELEDIFSPGRRAKGKREAGELSTVKPLNYSGDVGGDFKPAEVGKYLYMEEGTSPSRENVSTEKQRGVFNRINELLGEVDRIGESEPFRAAIIAADVDRYLADEESTLKERAGKLDESKQAWSKTVKKARRKYNRAKAGSSWGGLGGIVGAALGGGFVNLAGGGLGFLVGQDAEKRFGPDLKGVI